ncbi:hypothetical protein MPSEU_000150500 [Mayamaea pseudoterrestris]|nr:hypothetical protein MPSEU_000150500 [Mayamaea pseudoterrestris]
MVTHQSLQPFSLFQEANNASQLVMEKCARSVLRQVVLESLEQLVNLNEPQPQPQVIVTHEHLSIVRQQCRNLADVWCNKLQERGHFQAAASVRAVVEREEDNFYYDVDDDLIRQPTTTSEKPAIASQEPSTVTDDMQVRYPSKTALARIRQLTKQDIMRPEPQDKDALLASANEQLTQYGQAQQTDWPYSWKLIERAVQNIPNRLYNTKQGTPTIELIPRSIWEKQQEQLLLESDPDVIDKPEYNNETRQLILRRRRRRRSTNTRDQHIAKRSRVALLIVEETPRVASTQPARVQLSLNSHDFVDHDIDQYVHAEDVSATDRIDACLLAPLLSIGHTHYTRQMLVHAPCTSTWSNRQWKLAQRKARMERLGPHSVCKDADESRSKVRRTVDANGVFWMDFDLGRTMLELGPAEDKRLYVFESVEAILLDEEQNDALNDAEADDEDSDDAGYNDNDESGK